MELIIALYGISGSGKTTTIREIIQVLRDRGILDDFQSIRDEADIEAVVIINGIPVGIVSQGDPDSNSEQKLCEMVERDTQVIITACRTRGETVHIINRVAKASNARVIWTSSYYDGFRDAETRARLNRLKAQHLTELLINELQAAE